MDYSPCNYLYQNFPYTNKLTKGIVQRTVNRLLGVKDALHENIDGLQMLACSEPFIWCPWIQDYGRNMAYGTNCIPKLKREMSYQNQLIALKAICCLNELSHNPETAIEIIRLNIVPRFVKTLKSPNIHIVKKSLLCIQTLCNQPLGLAAVIDNKYLVENIRECILHQEAYIRLQAAKTVNALSHNYFAIHTLVQASFVKIITKCILETKDFNLKQPVIYSSANEMTSVIVEHLDSLLVLLDDGDQAKVELIAAGIFDISHFLREEKCDSLRKSTANIFIEVAKHPIGKKGIIAHNMIPLLCNGVLYAADMEVKTAMAAVLQFATIDKEGRKQAFNTSLPEALVSVLPLVNVPLSFKRCSLKILTNFAELPEGRQFLRMILKHATITILITYQDEQIKLIIQQLFDIINWNP